MSSMYDWWGMQIALAHQAGKIPHGPTLPDTMKWQGDFFILENADGTDTLYTWWGRNAWNKGPTLVRPHDHDA